MSPLVRQLARTGAVTLGAAALVFGVAAPPEHCPEVTPDQTHAAAGAAVAWLVDNQRADGSWLYEYDRASDVARDDYNEVRHAGVMSSLYQAAGRGFDAALASADRGLDWASQHLVERHHWVGMTDSGAVQAGSNALLLAALAERRLQTGDTSHDDLMVGLADFLVAQTEPSGAVLAYYDLGPDAPRVGTYSRYYTGETYWALGRMHQLFPDDGWGEVADRIGNYLATARDDVEDVWPPLADHWAGYGVAETAAFPERPPGEPLTDAELDLVRRQAGLIGGRVRTVSQRFGPWGEAVRGSFTPRGGGYGVFGEGLTGLWRASQLDDRLTRERAALAERASCIAGLAIASQVGDGQAADWPEPGKVAGAWFDGDTTRMDDQQHALSALLMTTAVLEAAPGAAGAGHPAPVWLLWFLVVVATINPVRVAVGTSAGRTRARTVAGGGALGAAALVLVGSASGWLLDVLDVSRPAIRLGAASVCLLSAAIDFVLPRPGDLPEQPRHPELVPVMVPLVLRPALLIAGWSIVADHGLWAYGGALVATVILAVLATAVPADRDVTHPMVAWLVRIISAVAIAGSLLLIVNAIFDL